MSTCWTFIHMPELSGMELADRLHKRVGAIPSIVFVTAHHEHAVAAFERHAVDYVLKPFSPERIREALDVAIRRTESERAAQLISVLPQLETLLSKARKIAIKTKGRILFIDPMDVVIVEAQGNYVLLQQYSGSYLLRESISAMAEKLKPGRQNIAGYKIWKISRWWFSEVCHYKTHVWNDVPEI